MQSVILVTGATGHVGRHVVSQLLRMGAAVRALTRNPDSAGLPGDVDVVHGDLSVPDTLDGVEAVFLVWPGLPAEFAPAVLDAVTKHAGRIVYLSSLSVRNDLKQQSDPITAFHADIERLIEQSGLEWTFLRCSGFATNTLGWAPQIRADGVVRWPYGAAARSLIHERDIAAVAVRALTRDGHGATKKELLFLPQLKLKFEIFIREIKFILLAWYFYYFSCILYFRLYRRRFILILRSVSHGVQTVLYVSLKLSW